MRRCRCLKKSKHLIPHTTARVRRLCEGKRASWKATREHITFIELKQQHDATDAWWERKRLPSFTFPHLTVVRFHQPPLRPSHRQSVFFFPRLFVSMTYQQKKTSSSLLTRLSHPSPSFPPPTSSLSAQASRLYLSTNRVGLQFPRVYSSRFVPPPKVRACFPGILY